MKKVLTELLGLIIFIFMSIPLFIIGLCIIIIPILGYIIPEKYHIKIV
jgi:hypothetical protein